MSRNYYCKDKAKLSYDYDKQVWIIDGKYQRCGHPESINCDCYGRLHANEEVIITEACN